MKDLFIADAHLKDPADSNYVDLLEFLTQQAPDIRNLVILGDLFEFWIGTGDGIPSRYRPVVSLLEELHRQGVQLTYVEGNHDFHLGPVFRHRLDGTILPDGGGIELDGLRIHLAHGDLVNQHDIAYRRWRRLVRSRVIRHLAAFVPTQLSWAVARSLSRLSHRQRQNRPPFDASQLLTDYARQKLNEGYDLVVTGHYHQPLLRDLDGGRLVALGDWIERRSYAVLEDGVLQLRDWRDPT